MALFIEITPYVVGVRVHCCMYRRESHRGKAELIDSDADDGAMECCVQASAFGMAKKRRLSSF